MIFLFVLSMGLFLESFLHYRIFLEWVSKQLQFGLNDEQRWKIATSFGLVSLFLSIIFGGVAKKSLHYSNRGLDSWQH